MLGDQIYADLWGRHHGILRADTFEEFQERYRSAFETPNLRKLMQSLPTYMILDDHEIEDNWHQSRIHIPKNGCCLTRPSPPIAAINGCIRRATTAIDYTINSNAKVIPSSCWTFARNAFRPKKILTRITCWVIPPKTAPTRENPEPANSLATPARSINSVAG